MRLRNAFRQSRSHVNLILANLLFSNMESLCQVKLYSFDMSKLAPLANAFTFYVHVYINFSLCPGGAFLFIRYFSLLSLLLICFITHAPWSQPSASCLSVSSSLG